MSDDFPYRVGEFLVLLSLGWLLSSPSFFWFYGFQGGLFALGNVLVFLVAGVAIPTVGEWRWQR